MSKEKKVKREEILAMLSEIDESERIIISSHLQHELFSSTLWQEAQTVGLYLSNGLEWDTRNIVEQGFKEGKTVAIPKTIPDTKEMLFYQISTMDQTMLGNFDLLEPIIEQTRFVKKDEIDLLLVPGLVFSRDGYRIGFGGGYYDRYLADFIHSTISIAFSEQIVDFLPIESFDIPVNYIITEEGLI